LETSKALSLVTDAEAELQVPLTHLAATTFAQAIGVGPTPMIHECGMRADDMTEIENFGTAIKTQSW
jgi:hypothetical protein